MRCIKSLLIVGVVSVVAQSADGLTIVLDFKSTAQGTTSDLSGNQTGAFDVTSYGFSASGFGTVANSVLNMVRNAYYGIPTKSTLSASPIPAGQQLDIDFVLGDIGSAPSNGDSEYYFVQIGSKKNTATILGTARTNSVRYSNGSSLSFLYNRSTVATIYSDNIRNLTGITPSNALTIGNLDYTTFAIGGTVAHEIGHTLSLSHLSKAGAVTPSGLPPLMGTGAIDLPSQDRLGPREFALSGFDGENNNAARYHIQQLVNAVGLREAPIPEPASLALVVTTGFFLTRRRRVSYALYLDPALQH